MLVCHMRVSKADGSQTTGLQVSLAAPGPGVCAAGYHPDDAHARAGD